jgi:hypothetical protein
MNVSNFGTIQETGGSNNIGLFSTGATTVANSGTIQVTGTSGIQATAIFTTSGTTTVTNNSGGIIQGASPNSIALVAQSSTASTSVTNLGTISGGIDGVNTNTTGTTSVVNSGTITGTNWSGVRVNSASITNSTGGLITGSFGIFSRSGGGVSVTDAGMITGTVAGGTAIQFSSGLTNTLQLGAGFAINGAVAGGTNNVFQLGGSGTGTGNFDLSKIGTQYQNFTTFSVEGGVWNVINTFSQTQTWNVNSGTLGGTGTLASLNVNNGGTLAPGTNKVSPLGGIGTLTVNGNLALQSGAFYLVGVTLPRRARQW